MANKEDSEQEGVADACASVMRTVNVSALNDQQHESVLMEKVLKVYTIETKQELAARIKSLNGELSIYEADATKEREKLVKLANAAIKEHLQKDRSLEMLRRALGTFGVQTSQKELFNSASAYHYDDNYTMPRWATQRRGWLTYEVELNMHINGNDVKVTKQCRLTTGLQTALASWGSTIKVGEKLQANIDMLEKELKELPAKSQALEAQVLRSQIISDPKLGRRMTELLDAARAAQDGGFMRLL